MKGFAFRLERILRLRADQERQQARRLGDAAREEERLDQACRDQESHVERVGDQLTQPPGGRSSAGWLRVLSLAADAAAEQLAGTERSREEARQSVETERERLKAAQVERKSLERLKDKQAIEWKDAARRTDQRTTDEIAGRRHRKDETR